MSGTESHDGLLCKISNLHSLWRAGECPAYLLHDLLGEDQKTANVPMHFSDSIMLAHVMF